MSPKSKDKRRKLRIDFFSAIRVDRADNTIALEFFLVLFYCDDPTVRETVLAREEAVNNRNLLFVGETMRVC